MFVVYFITKNIIENIRNVQGIFCLDNAASYYELSTCRPTGFSLLTDDQDKPEHYEMGIVTFHRTSDLTNNLVKLPSGNYVTNLDRTILEIMDYMPIDEFTSQKMEDYGLENKLEHLSGFNKQFHYCSDENFNLALKCYEEWISDPH